MHGQIKGTAWCHIGHKDPLLSNILPAAVTVGSLLLSQGCIFQLQVVCWVRYLAEWVYIATDSWNWQISQLHHRETKPFFVCLQLKGQFYPGLTKWATVRAPELYWVLAQQPKCHTNFKFYSFSCSAYLVSGTTHGWTDTTASWQLATILTDANDNFTRQAVDPEMGART